MNQASRRSSRTGLLLVIVLFLFALLLIGVVAWGFLVSGRVAPAPVPVSPSPPPAAGASVGAPVEVHFTTPHFPERAEERRGGMDERLTEFLQTATHSIDMAIYQFDLINVAQAMLDAHKRGVRVRVVTDTDSMDKDAVQSLVKAGIPVVEDKRSVIMHHKFAVVDGAAVWMGSWNFTGHDTYRFNNNGALWRNQQLAENYTAVFEKMFGGKFGPTKPKEIPHPVITVNDARIETYFSAETNPVPAIVKRLQGAQRDITFMAFSFTHDDIGAAMLERGQSGVRIRGIFERTGSETQFSEFGRFKEAGFDVLQDGNPYLMHHKVIVIDETTVIFGSFNFSANAATSNDENLLIVDDRGMARLFLDEYERVRAVALNPPARR